MNKTITCNKKVFGTYEWAEKTINIIDGCRHDCKYCYSKSMAVRFKRLTADSWKDERLRNNSAPVYVKRIEGTIMYPSTHDIHPLHIDTHIECIDRILRQGNRLLIVSKPHLACIKTICSAFNCYRDKILFRFTIGSADSATLKFWEPGAPDFQERLAALKYAHSRGYKTSISCEPMLDDKIFGVISEVYEYVTDAIWLGKANRLITRLKVNGAGDNKTLKQAQRLIAWQSDEKITRLYEELKNDRKIKWKESIKAVVGLEIPTEKGLDI